MENQDSQVTVVLTHGETLNFSYKTTLARAAQIIAFLSTEESAPTLSPVLLNSSTITQPRRVAGSPMELLRQAEAKTYPQKIAVLGQFITQRDGNETFDTKDVLSLLRRMGDMPKNFGRDLKSAELLGYVMPEPNGQHLLTEIGLEAIENQFINAVSPTSNRKKRSTKKKVSSAQEQE